VTGYTDPDYLMITFNDAQLFYSIRGKIIPEKHRVLRKRLPRLLPNGIEGRIYRILAGIILTSETTIAVGNFILHWLLGASLNHLWSLINTQQLIVLFPLLDTNMPANAMAFYRTLMRSLRSKSLRLTIQ